ncbi:MAG: four helix bundle protein [Saprospiraceae bacterium]|nr:four helix bundle protein [Saprospiraceae bacterium]MCF8250623.1 four helix bundle protein [Saprospiraceae bacterium]MCF8282398.1 four helix bundle protein [Bacteroidales bacterium]MCF8312254.1 four helix bundle protein [Saprospiraceae bacterium]MCF8442811.1 four helix bundle protein [Saprospiraceae bacterium]
MEYKSFTKLDVYQECRKFRKMVSDTVKKYFPKDEKFLITAQLLDASRSITANLAEGHGRFYYQDSIKFCRISRGSLEESLEHLITAFDEGYLTSEILKTHKIQYDTCLRLINGYIRYLDNSKRGEKA